MWLENLFVKDGEEQCKWLATVFWAVWHPRNNVYRHCERQSVSGLISFVKAYYIENSKVEIIVATSINLNGNAWYLSMTNVVKVNFDASFNKHEHSLVSGITFRNGEGYILVACTCPNNFVVDATTVEARAYLQLMILAEELGFRRLVVEGDSLTIVKKVQ
ncbi:hypothetical protein PVK06_048826 [Gossypium arboreum]|uniref:RNase H type-1 domain-containing protein n=1 Tax=Gossypium arboreum TaxID=29729 RepID=A0ABR0MHI4_GOSAR|nr:hypothetical protein PVK06_048826 [Gossypium arboreum]